tara:strand:- start:2396 stop:5296 length:2901 start_codon:yes stop_codon:yes gene_type:complete
MPVKNFKFVSPGVFVNEIDNSNIPKTAAAIGPVVIGRSSKGMGMTPIKVESYEQFVEVFGETVPGSAGGDVYRNGNQQSPMYGTYAAKAFLNANVAPLTYIRLLGQEDANASGAGKAGWKTTNNAAATGNSNGGAYGLWVWPSSSHATQLGGNNSTPGILAGVWYLNSGSQIYLSGTLFGGAGTTGSLGAGIGTDANNRFTVYVSGAYSGEEKINFGFDDTDDNFIRAKFNTNPQLASDPGTFFPNSSHKSYWLGESFTQDVRTGFLALPELLTGDGGSDLTNAALHGVMLPIALSGTPATGPHSMQAASSEAKAGWFIGQDLGAPASYVPQDAQRLFRLVGRGHGEWLQRNCKVSIERIRQSTAAASDYGTFSVVIREISDRDDNIQVLERFDGCSLDPSSPSFIGIKIGNKYTQWDSASRRLKTYGEYDNQSAYVYVELDEAIETGAPGLETLLPFGYFGPPRFTSTAAAVGAAGSLPNYMIGDPNAIVNGTGTRLLSSSANNLTGRLGFPSTRLRHSSSDGGVSDPYFGFQTTRTATSNDFDASVADASRRWLAASVADPVTGTPATGVDGYSYVFSLDDVVQDSAQSAYYYASGSRASEKSATSASYTTLLDADINRFTAPFCGGYDGFDITLPDPVYNKAIPGAGGSGTGTATNQNSMAYYTYRRAIDTVADAEMIDMNLLAAPGLTHEALTKHMVRMCESRGDALALIDLPDIYIPSHEEYKSAKSERHGTTPTQAATTLRNRRIDSSYGATFYPWVQTRDDNGQRVWTPPSVAMMGVLASSEKKSDLWFAPAGFNRGGISDGAAGIPVVGVSERLTSKERDTLYESRINPIASFPGNQIVVFGQKTLQERESALDRINVRRLVIYMKKQISILATQVLFQQNTDATWLVFKGLIQPFLDNVLTGYGISDYRLILDKTTTTADLIDQNILYAKIMVKPTRAIEYIAIDFTIASTGASFDD